VSFLCLKAKCFFCKQPISWRYPLIEILTLVLSVIAFVQFGFDILLLPVLLFTYALIALTFIDIDVQILPDVITLPLLGIGLALNSFYYFTTPADAIWGMLLGFTLLFSIDYLYYLVRKRHGLGMGDAKLLAAIGAWLGASALVPVILIASLLGLFCAVILMLLKRLKYDMPIPFGPFLAIAAWGYLICG
jgi:leader peptidase (prepilin peptidase)/N-methyltransferase